MLRNIHQLGESEVLRKKARELSIAEIKSEKIQQLIEEMKTTMRDAPGVGLAAPQIGESIQLAVIEEQEERLKVIDPEILKDRGRKPVAFHVIINPVITHKGGKTNYFFEGCLSVSNRMRITPRFDEVQVKCLDENAEEKVINASGWYARILQHEIDHLHGKLYVDVSNVKTELSIDEEFKEKWMNATREDILSFFKQKCPDEDINDSSISNRQEFRTLTK